jgi:DNA repair exonuclease SbcCD nuclease subunit
MLEYAAGFFGVLCLLGECLGCRSVMPSFSFVHTADLHLDSPFSALGLRNPVLADIMRSATFEAFDKVIHLCLEERVDFLLVAGDVYDGEDRSLRAQVRFRDGLKRLSRAGIRSFVVHGNHDPLSGWSSQLEWPGEVHLFGDHAEIIEIRRGHTLLATVEGISYPAKEERRNLSRLFKGNKEAFHIALLHANLGSNTGHEPYAPCSLADLMRTGIDYWALGHVHNPRILTDGQPCVCYPGNTQGRNIRETGERGCILVRVSHKGEIACDFRSTHAVRWATKVLSVTTMNSEEDLLKGIEGICRETALEASGNPAVLRLSLVGRGPLFGRLASPHALYDLTETARDIGMALTPFVWIEQIRSTLKPAIDLEMRREERGYLGELLRYSNELALNPELSILLIKDLSPLFDDRRTRRFLDLPPKDTLVRLLKEAEWVCAEHLSESDM